jgi:hypothetical protein
MWNKFANISLPPFMNTYGRIKRIKKVLFIFKKLFTSPSHYHYKDLDDSVINNQKKKKKMLMAFKRNAS